MFFMMGITDGHKDLDFSQMTVCPACGAYGRFQAFMTYTELSLFFIPCLKWGRKYYVRLSCCASVYQLDDEIGRRIASGESVEIKKEHLREMQQGNYRFRTCGNCGFSTREDFDFCPKCGRRF